MRILKPVNNEILGEVFTIYKNIKIYHVKSKKELYGLMNKMPLRLLFDGETLFAWSAFTFDHGEIKEILKDYDIEVEDFEGFLIENQHLVPSLQRKSDMVDKFLKKYFPMCKYNRDDEGIIL